jgi:DNA polymerase III sliding clamp (beta) subunit (PCNA family)
MNALELLYPSVATKATAEELGCFRLKGQIIRASDAVSMVQVDLGVDTGLNCLIPATELYKLLKGLATEEVTLTQDADGVALVAGKVKGHFAILQESQIIDLLDFTVDAWQPAPAELLKALSLCLFSASKDASRGVLCGVNVNGAQITSTDGSRVSRYTAKDCFTEASVTVPCGLIARMTAYGEAVTGWAVKGDTIYFRIGENAIIGSKVVAGVYPNADNFFQQAAMAKAVVVFPVGATDSLKRHQDLQADVDPVNRRVDLVFDGNLLSIKSSDSSRYDLQEELLMETGVPVKFTLGINPAFLTDILQRTKSMQYDPKINFVVFDCGAFRHLAMGKG